MTDAFVAALDATAERAVAIYARQLAAGDSDAEARAYAIAYAGAFGRQFLEGYESGRLRERQTLKALHDSYAAHGPVA